MNQGGIFLEKDNLNIVRIIEKKLDKKNTHKIAVLYNDEAYTYNQLSININKLGNVLRGVGVEIENRVALLLYDTPEFIYSFFGAAKIGAIPVPLNTYLTANEYCFLLNDSRAKVIVVDEYLYPLINDIRHLCPFLKKIFITGDSEYEEADSLGSKMNEASYDLVVADTKAADMAFWLYSSGSTGKPKAVVHLHKDIPDSSKAFADKVLSLNESDVCFSTSKLFHAYGFTNSITLPFSRGATTILNPLPSIAETILNVIKNKKPTIFFATPKSYKDVLEFVQIEKVSINHSIRVCVSAAEPLPVDIYNQWKNIFGVDIFDGIGCTETLHTFISNDSKNIKPGSSGKIVFPNEAKIVDEKGVPVSDGVVGNLMVKTSSTAPFYWNKHELSKDTFRGDWLYTRDKYLVDKDGFYWFQGRCDDMLKINGAWVSPVEVEVVLLMNKKVHDCVVIGVDGGDGLMQIVAYIQLNSKIEETDILKKELKSFVKQKIGISKSPQIIIITNDLPSTSTGKKQRYKLRDSVLKDIYRPDLQNKRFDICGARKIFAEIYKIIKEISGLSLKQKHNDQTFQELGIDSILSVALVNRVNRKLELNLPVSILFEYFTISKLANYLEGILFNTKNEKNICSVETGDIQNILPKVNDNDVAIVAYYAKVPGASSLDEFWDNLKLGKSFVQEVPASRWDYRNYYDQKRGVFDKTYCKWGGFLSEIDMFDADFFSILPHEAELIDPQHRLFLESCYFVLQQAGYPKNRLKKFKCGLFAGVMSNEYQEMLFEASQNDMSAYELTGNASSMFAGRISYYLDLNGPTMTIDTACSSSLVAVDRACKAIISGEADMMLAGGVTLYLSPKSFVRMSQAEMLSSDGKCKSFDEKADGFVPGEGVSVVLLKKLSEALKDKDYIHGVIKGSAINHDGKSNGLTAPNKKAQSNLIEEVYSKYDINPESLDYIEAHGTGTKLGDPIELDALSDVFNKRTKLKQFCALGSVKTNIGHASAAAGGVGLVKLLLCLDNQQLVPSINYTSINKLVDLSNSPFYIQDSLSPWLRTPFRTRRAAISSFGLSGTNAHLVLEESVSDYKYLTKPERPFLVVFSDKSIERLMLKLDKTKSWLMSHVNDYYLGDIAYTLFCRRDHFKFRKIFIARTIYDLVEQLKEYIAGFGELEKTILEKQSEKESVSDQDAETLEGISKLFLEGKEMTGIDLYPENKYRVVPILDAVFIRKSFWALKHCQKKSLMDSKSIYCFNSIQQKVDLSEEFLGLTSNEVIVLFDNNTKMLSQLKKHVLFRDIKIIFVKPCKSFRKEDDRTYCFDTRYKKNHEQLITLLLEQGLVPSRIIFNLAKLVDINSFNKEFCYQILNPIIFMYQAVVSSGIKAQIRIITLNSFDYNSAPIGYGLFGLASSIPKKSNVFFINLDIDCCQLLPEKKVDILGQLVFCESIKNTSLSFIKNNFYCKKLVKNNEQGRAASIMPKEGNTYLIIGGSGALGFEVACYLAHKVSCNIVLASRSGFDKNIAKKLNHLRGFGVVAEFFEIDVADFDSLELNIAKIKDKYKEINGVFHCAGLAADNSLLNCTDEDIERITTPKVLGTMLLDKATKDEPLEFFIAFSSVSVFFGDFNRGCYAVANSFMDEYIESKRNNSCRYITVNWPLWELGMQLAEDDLDYYYLSGFSPLPSKMAINVLDEILKNPLNNQYIIFYGENEKIYEMLNGRSLVLGLGENGDLLMPSISSLDQVMGRVKSVCSNLLKKGVNEVDIDLEISQMGFDSILIMMLLNSVKQIFNISVEPMVFAAYPTIKSFSYYIYKQQKNV
jgi:benzoate-CoA ligase family protein